MLLEELIERKSIRGFQQGFQKRRSMKLPKTYQVVQIQGSDHSLTWQSVNWLLWFWNLQKALPNFWNRNKLFTYCQNHENKILNNKNSPLMVNLETETSQNQKEESGVLIQGQKGYHFGSITNTKSCLYLKQNVFQGSETHKLSTIADIHEVHINTYINGIFSYRRKDMFPKIFFSALFTLLFIWNHLNDLQV